MKIANIITAAGLHGVGMVEGDEVRLIGSAESVEELLALGELGSIEARAGDSIPLASVKLRAPVERPSKFLAIAANYQSHIDEVKAANPAYVPPTSQRWFCKLPSCINPPFAPIVMPLESRELDHEVELGVVIGTRCRRVPRDEALGVVAGFTIVNDVSVRDWQKRSPTIVLGKSFDTHGPVGPWLVTADEIDNPHALELRCLVNGEVRQRGSTAEMIDSIGAQIEYLSTVATLEPGDLIATGTPVGTGGSRMPPLFLEPGDIVRCEIEQIGHIEAVVIEELA